MKNILIIPILLMLSLNLVSATQEEMKPAELNKPYYIVQTCASCSYVNGTLTNKNGIVFENVAFTNNGSGNWIYEFTPNQVGRHDLNGFGDLNGVQTSFATKFEVTGSGLTGTTGFYVLILVLSLGLIFLGFYMQDAPILIFGALGLYFIGLYILFFGIDGIKDTVYTWALGIIVLMVASYVSIRASYELITT